MCSWTVDDYIVIGYAFVMNLNSFVNWSVPKIRSKCESRRCWKLSMCQESKIRNSEWNMFYSHLTERLQDRIYLLLQISFATSFLWDLSAINKWVILVNKHCLYFVRESTWGKCLDIKSNFNCLMIILLNLWYQLTTNLLLRNAHKLIKVLNVKGKHFY